MIETDESQNNKRVIGRALLIIAYGVTALPSEGLEAFENSLDLKM